MNGGRVLRADVGIVGAGPGGMAVARALSAAGVAVTVLDEGARLGGQIFRQLPAGFAAHGRSLEPPSHQRGHELLAALDELPVQVVHGATVWNASPGRLWFEQDGQSWLLRCQRIVLAPGAYDRCIPFPGWTLPGVITAGAAQVMVRGFGLQPGRRALVAGSGPLLLPTVTALLSAGVEVVAALEACSRSSLLRALPSVFGSGARLREAWFYARALWRRGVRLRPGWTVFAALGDQRVQRAVIGRVDRHGRPLRSTARTIDVDVVCAGFGLVPSIELAQLLGCEVEWNAVRGGWCVRVDDRGQTSVPGVLAVGEIAGIGGAEVAIAEGELAAAQILEQVFQRPLPARTLRRRRSERRAADALLAAFPQLPGLFELADQETVVCRCEDVRLGPLRAAAALFGNDARGLKMGTRAGMGPCQARICGPSLQCLARPGAPLQMDCPVVQVPVKPVSVQTMIDAPMA
ncbi:MAG TPA: FAD-dependent oxidoreductase [Planctomycetota bacterium]|nr:FAD-dependent oxidoreductase [Planctomycetota bacterium]